MKSLYILMIKLIKIFVLLIDFEFLLFFLHSYFYYYLFYIIIIVL